MLSLLPKTLLAVLFALPVFSQVSNNDPFRVLVLNTPKPELEICRLKPLAPMESVDEEVLLSFEEWKRKQLAIHRAELADDREKANQNSPVVDITNTGGNASNIRSDGGVAFPDANATAGSSVRVQSSAGVAPHFRVPITDRFNYANIDCSSRVHTSHRSAKSSSSILSSKKDRYMLSPCNTRNERQFVVVELCDDIRIDTVQLANFEFFSGVFKEFTVSVAKTYTTDPEGWTFAGAYRAKNVRGVQSFHPPTSLRDFYRFIRIDFLSHYGNEYYCPVSLLRVYGLTHLEEWKWDIWQAESRAKLQKEAQGVLPAVEVISAPLSTSSAAASSVSTDSIMIDTDYAADSVPTLQVPTSGQAKGKLVSSNFPSAIEAIQTSSVDYNIPSDEINDTLIDDLFVSMTSTSISASSTTVTAKFSPSDSSFKRQPSTDTPASSSFMISSVSLSHEPLLEPSSLPLNDQSISQGINQSVTSTTKPITSLGTTSSSSIYHHAPPPPPSGESVYRTIMNRLTALENNQTLYMKYVEQQNGALRDVIKRLGEDLGRLETIVSFCYFHGLWFDLQQSL